MINLAWLKTFCTLVDVGHFTQTAERLFMTQSGVSQHIRKLEQSLATALIVREGKRFWLTQEGHRLYREGGELLAEINSLSASFEPTDEYRGLVSIMSPGSLGLKLYPELLSLQKQHQLLSIDYQFSSNRGIEQALCQYQLDIGLMTALPSDTNIVAKSLTREPIVLVTPSSLTTPTWPELTQLGIIDHPDAHHHAKLLLSRNFEQFQHIGQFNVSGRSNQISLILTPVALGLGFTVLPLYAAKAFADQKAVNIHFLSEQACESVYICRHRRATINQSAGFIERTINSYFN